MENNIEKEYKLLVNKEDFNTLLSFYPQVNFIKQINHYYDNSDMQIHKNHGAMRIREKEGHFFFTLKKFINNDLMEYECEVEKNDASIFEQEDIKKVLASFNIKGPFNLICSLQTKRAIHYNENYELCFDINEYNNTIDYEIEYEYTQEHDGLTSFKEILKRANLTYQKNATSKIQRAYKSLKIKV